MKNFFRTFNNFNPNVPPPGVLGGRMQIPSMNHPPPSLFSQQNNSGSTGFSTGYSRPNFSGRIGYNSTLPPGTESDERRLRPDYSSDES